MTRIVRAYAFTGAIGLVLLGVSQTRCYRLGASAIEVSHRFVDTCVNENEACPATVRPELLAKLRSKGLPLRTTGRDGQKEIDDRTWTLSVGTTAPDGSTVEFDAESIREGESFRIVRLTSVTFY